jgi:NAD(P)H-dependent FMN reductase
MKTLIISCSQRPENLSFRASQAIQKYFPASEIIDMREFPLAMIGVQDEVSVKNLEAILEKFNEANHIVFVSPEYNWGISPCCKNLIDHLSGLGDIWSDKVFMCFGCSAGRGGRQPVIELWRILNKIIALSNSISIVSPYHIEITSNLLSEENSFVDSFSSVSNSVFSHHHKLAKKFLGGH